MEVHLDVTPTLTIGLNVSEHIINSRPPLPNAPFSSPLGMLSLDFENVRPPHFTLLSQLPLYCHLIDPMDGIILHYHCLGQVLQGKGLILRSAHKHLKKSLHSFTRSGHFNASKLSMIVFISTAC
jgi:hypothetical protein